MSPEPLARSEPPALVFPTIGALGTTWGLPHAQVTEWGEQFPSLDVMAEMRKAQAWVTANTGNRKTGRGMLRFLVGWLTRAVDRRGPRREQQPPAPHRSLDARPWRQDCTHEPKCQHRWQHFTQVAREARTGS